MKHISPRLNLVGQKFGYLTVRKFSHYKWTHSCWICECCCGRQVIKKLNALRRNKVKSCGCKTKALITQQLIRRHGLQYQEASFNRLYRDYRDKARKRGLAWRLSKAQARKLFTQDCFYCGVKPFRKYSGVNGHFVYNGIDRVNTNNGYNIQNCVTCCSDCNIAKWDKSLEDFKAWIQRVYKYMFKREN